MERSDQSLRLHFLADDLARAELERLVSAERVCCGFVDWQLKEVDEELLLTVSGPNDGVAAIAEAFLSQI